MAYFGVEFGLGKRCSESSCSSLHEIKGNKMVKKTSKRKTVKQKKQQAKFGKAVKKCHKKTESPKSFGSCMSKELKRRKK